MEKNINIVGGEKNKNKHFHLKFNLDQSERYRGDRDLINKMSRKIESKKFGHLSNEEIILQDGQPSFNFLFEINIDDKTKEVKISKLEFINDY